MTEAQKHTPKKKKRKIQKRLVPHVWKAGFIEHLRKHGNISAAARSVNVERKAAYDAKQTDLDFAAQWEDAIEEATDALEAEARRRALEGILVESYDKDGNLRSTRMEYSDTLMIVLLKAHRPEKFKERFSGEVNTKGSLTVDISTPQSRAQAEAELREWRKQMTSQMAEQLNGISVAQTPLISSTTTA